MPFEGINDPQLPSNVQKLTKNQRDAWVKTFNNVFSECRKDGEDESKCETLAFTIANGTIIKEVDVEDTKEELCTKHGKPADKCLACRTGATSFEEVEAVQKVEEQTEAMGELTTLAEGMVGNVLHDPDIPIDEKPGRLEKIMNGLVERVRKIGTNLKNNLPRYEGNWEPIQRTDDIITVPNEKQVTKTENGVQFKASDYAVVSDAKEPSTWKLPLAEKRSGNFTVAQVARAITAMQPSGSRGEKVQLTADQRKQAVSRITTVINKVDGTDDQKDNLRTRLAKVKDLPAPGSFTITKDLNGDMRWLGFPSNKWRDRDVPAQIIEESAHLEFINYLDKTKDYPVLLSWHTAGARIGIADVVDYSDGFLVMSGPIDKDKYAEAERIIQKCETEPIGMSHGFVYSYSNKEQEIIGKYRMWEVSHLPLPFAANVWTSIDILTKEGQQMFNPEKRKYLVEVLGEEAVVACESKTTDLNDTLSKIGAEWKDLTEIPQPDVDGLAVAAAKAVTESESFKVIAKAVVESNAALTELKDKTVPSIIEHLEAVETTAKEAKEKAGQSVDKIISEAVSPKVTDKGHQASQKGEELSDEDKERAKDTEITAPIDTKMEQGFLGTRPAEAPVV